MRSNVWHERQAKEQSDWAVCSVEWLDTIALDSQVRNATRETQQDNETGHSDCKVHRQSDKQVGEVRNQRLEVDVLGPIVGSEQETNNSVCLLYSDEFESGICHAMSVGLCGASRNDDGSLRNQQ